MKYIPESMDIGMDSLWAELSYPPGILMLIINASSVYKPFLKYIACSGGRRTPQNRYT